MARIRTIKPDFWQDYRLATELPREVRLFYIGLWNEADDDGRFLAHPRRLLGAIFPYDEDVSVAEVEAMLVLLSETKRIALYEVGGEPYGELRKFAEHQRINRPTPSKIPPPPDDSLSPHGGLTEGSPPEGKGKEGEIGKGKEDAARAPREQPAGNEAAAYRWKVDLETYAEEHGYGPRDRLIAIGEDITAWRTPDGTVVPAADRLRMLKLADGHLEDPKGKAHDRRSALKYVIAQQYDPFTVAKAEDRPKPGTEAAAVKSETPARYRTGGTTHGLVPIGGAPQKPEPPAPVDFEAERIKRWEADNPEEAERVRTVIAARIANGQERAPAGQKARAAFAEAEYRKRVVEAMNRKGAA